ncbi:MAG: hypothetical protein KatS3mg110_4146 [Pirellulaceae bacterium]|nr:MAG: hypothetical protein KatS3mg110_4146 [Pirellulaceae bacterium]
MNTCAAMSESVGGSVAGKLVTALPCRSSIRRSICITSTLRLQPFSRTLRAYQRRASGSATLLSKTQLWNQGICAATCCTICRLGQAAAKARMYLRLRGESPCISGDSRRRSAESRSTTLTPQPSRCWRSRMAQPMSHYNRTIAALAVMTARRHTCRMRCLSSASRSA